MRKQEEIRNKILDVARDIISREGTQSLSIRKITNAIDYSPGIIYHYFKDKNEIVETLVGEGYQRILAAIGSVSRNEHEPEKEIKEAFTNYLKAALTSPEVYKAFMLNDDPAVLQKTALLEQGIAQKSRTLQFLCSSIQRGIDNGRFAPCDPELTSQVIWTATFGLVIKLVLEKNIPEQQINRLLERNFEVLFNGIMIRS